MKFNIKEDNIIAEIVVFAVLIFVFQILKYLTPIRFTIFIDFVLSLLLGLILAYSAVYLFGPYKKKKILRLAIIIGVFILLFLGLHSVLNTLFVMIGVLFAIISLSDNLIKDMIKKERKR